MLLPRDLGRGYDRSLASIQPYQVGNLQTWDEKLADLQLADSSTGGAVGASFGQDA